MCRDCVVITFSFAIIAGRGSGLDNGGGTAARRGLGGGGGVGVKRGPGSRGH